MITCLPARLNEIRQRDYYTSKTWLGKKAGVRRKKVNYGYNAVDNR